MKLEFLKNGMYNAKKYKKGDIVEFNEQDIQVYLQINLCRIALNQKEIKKNTTKEKAPVKNNTNKNNKKVKTKVGEMSTTHHLR